MESKLLSFLENSFLKDYLVDKEITDVTFNGVSVYYQHNSYGKMKGEIQISNNEAIDFIRQIANLSEHQFSYAQPILDISEGPYRINAVHPSLVRVMNRKAVSFSIRIASTENKVKNDEFFMDDEIKKLLQDFVNNEESIVIGGATGTGKTELQKYLLSTLKANSRVIVLDNIQELEGLRENENIDLTSWQVNEHNDVSSFKALIANALRSNPDWLIVSEARGKEMADVLTASMTGHAIITTIHAKSMNMMTHRMVRLIEQGDKSQTYDEIMGDILSHIDNYIFLEKEIDAEGIVRRYIKEIGKADFEHKCVRTLYKRGN